MRTQHTELRALWREIHDSRTRACAAETEIVRVLAQLVRARERTPPATRGALARRRRDFVRDLKKKSEERRKSIRKC